MTVCKFTHNIKSTACYYLLQFTCIHACLGMSGKLRPTTPVFLGEIIKFQLSLPSSGKMNDMNALTLTNNNLGPVYMSHNCLI